MPRSKMYPYRGELDDEIRHSLFELGLEHAPLYVDTWGNVFAKVDNEGNYHPDDRNAARVYYQPLGVRA